MRILQTILIAFILNNFFVNKVNSQTTLTQEYGVSVGLLTEGSFYISELDENFGLESGFTLHGFYDHYITEKFSIGGNISVSFPSLEILDENVTFYEFALALKPRFDVSDKVTYKPGFNIGYRIINAPDIDEEGGTIQGLGLNLTNELQFHIDQGFTPFFDLGFISQPAGGNDDFNVTFSPLIMIRVGVVFN
ncbi:MAG: hypothetical protein AAFO99_04505 [Bacteroidota bacterium]